MRKIVLILVALSLAIITGAGSCSEDIERQDNAEKRAQENWSQIAIGDSENEVRSALGEPSDTQTMESGFGSSKCWYWGVGAYQVCFDDNGVVDSKNRY